MQGEPRLQGMPGSLRGKPRSTPPTGQTAAFVVKYAPEAGVPGLVQAERVPWNLIRFAPA